MKFTGERKDFSPPLPESIDKNRTDLFPDLFSFVRFLSRDTFLVTVG